MAVAPAQIRVSTHFCVSLAGDYNYAEGGAREARCREKELLGAPCWGGEEDRALSAEPGTKSSAAAASTGACSDWQMWQAFSGPFVCWWSRLPPVAKYSSTTQANTATARRTLVRPKIILPSCITSPLA